jgi:hypothetical protein
MATVPMPGVSVIVGRGAAAGRTVGAGVAVCVGLGMSAYPHRFSWVGVTLGAKMFMDALAGEVVKKKRTIPTPINIGNNSKRGRMRIRPFAGWALMESCWK